MIELIEKFLALKRFALIGVSRKPGHFSRLVMAEFIRRGFAVVPVNPNLKDLEGLPCFWSVEEIDPIPAAAMVMVSGNSLIQVVGQCVTAGVKIVWIVRGGQAQARRAAVELCREKGVAVIDGACPSMYIEDTTLPHAIHGWIWKAVGMWGK